MVPFISSIYTLLEVDISVAWSARAGGLRARTRRSTLKSLLPRALTLRSPALFRRPSKHAGVF